MFLTSNWNSVWLWVLGTCGGFIYFSVCFDQKFIFLVHFSKWWKYVILVCMTGSPTIKISERLIVYCAFVLETKPGCSPGDLDKHRFPNHGPKYSFLPSRWTWEGHCGRQWLPLKIINTSNTLVYIRKMTLVPHSGRGMHFSVPKTWDVSLDWPWILPMIANDS